MICSETEAREEISRNIALAGKRPTTARYLDRHRAHAGGAETRADRLFHPQFFLSAALARETFTFC